MSYIRCKEHTDEVLEFTKDDDEENFIYVKTCPKCLEEMREAAYEDGQTDERNMNPNYSP